MSRLVSLVIGGERGRRPRRAALTLVALLITAVMLFPLYWMVVNSLETDQEIFSIPAPLVPPHITFGAYLSTFADQAPHLLTSLIVAAGTVVVSLLIATPAAYALAHLRLPFSAVLIFCLLLSQMIPAVTLATPLFLIFERLNLLNSYPGLILADTTYAVPFDVLILAAFMEALPYELVEAACIDGTGLWGAFLRVMLPLALPGIITAGLFSFLFAWGDFLFGLTLMTTNEIEPISLSVYSYLGQFSSRWNDLMAVATMGAIPAAITLVFCQRYIAAGITAGALKG
jgi:multiple sugar transport system permease protein